jgi:hypothetical protein
MACLMLMNPPLLLPFMIVVVEDMVFELVDPNVDMSRRNLLQVGYQYLLCSGSFWRVALSVLHSLVDSSSPFFPAPTDTRPCSRCGRTAVFRSYELASYAPP